MAGFGAGSCGSSARRNAMGPRKRMTSAVRGRPPTLASKTQANSAVSAGWITGKQEEAAEHPRSSRARPGFRTNSLRLGSPLDEAPHIILQLRAVVVANV